MLDRCRYAPFVRSVRDRGGLWPRISSRSNLLEIAEPSLDLAVRLWLWGESVERARLERWLGGDTIDELCLIDALVPEGIDRIHSAFAIITCGSYYLMADPPRTMAWSRPGHREVYVDRDSITLAAIAARFQKRLVVDVGTGAGVIALAASRRSARVLGVERSLRAAKTARLNAILNGLSERVQIIASDLIACIGELPASALVCANLPSLPTPEWGGSSLAYSGGEDGLKALRTLGAQLATVMTFGQSAVLMVLVEGDEQTALRRLSDALPAGCGRTAHLCPSISGERLLRSCVDDVNDQDSWLSFMSKRYPRLAETEWRHAILTLTPR
jgi:hypothetical protein